MRRWDFVAAYLQGELLDNEVVYCSMPSGYETGLDANKPTGEDACLRINTPSTAWHRRGDDGNARSSPT